MLGMIIGDSYNKSIGDFYYTNIDNFYMNTNMKYPDFAKRLSMVWKGCASAPEKQTPLAKWLGFSQPTVNDWLNGKGLPSLDTAIKLANKFDVCVEWLVTGKGAKYPNEETQTTNHNGHLESANLTPEQLLLIKGMIAQFEQTNPVKAENKSLTYPTENVGGGG